MSQKPLNQVALFFFVLIIVCINFEDLMSLSAKKYESSPGKMMRMRAHADRIIPYLEGYRELGYLHDKNSPLVASVDKDAVEDVYALQFWLLPRVLRWNLKPVFILGNFKNRRNVDSLARSHGLTKVYDSGEDIVLFRKSQL